MSFSHFIPWILLAGSSLSGLCFERMLCGFLACAAIGSAWIDNQLTDLLALYCFGGIFFATITPFLKTVKRFCLAGVLLWGILGMLHLIPGFPALYILRNVHITPNSVPYDLTIHFDKPLLFIGLVLAWPKINKSSPFLKKKYFWLVPAIFAMLFMIAWEIGVIKIAFKVPYWIWLFALNNLFFVCTSEEALFRGWLQQILSDRVGPYMGIFLASAAFGAAHLAGGWLYALFACGAGIAYGIAYFSRSIFRSNFFTFCF